MADDEALVLASATEQLRRLRNGRVSVVELAEAHICQIARLNPRLNAFADFDAERVRAEARRLDGIKQPCGVLHGLPVTIKSSIATAGLRCEIGSLLHAGEIAAVDAVAVARLRAAGALILGTTNCPEFLMAYETANLVHGQTRNPWDERCTPGGSSGGESAAIAAGMSAAGVGSDSGGSVRIPAHFTGICALKPTPGRIPAGGHLPPCAGPFSVLGALGPMARTVEDLTLLFAVLSGQDVGDPMSAPVPLRTVNARELRQSTIGYFEDDELVPVTEETRAAVQAAAQALREQGFRVERIRMKTLEPLRRLWWRFFVQCGAMLYADEVGRGRQHLSSIFREFLGFAEQVPELTARELLESWVELDRLRGETLEAMREYPLLLCPVASVAAFAHGERSWQIDGVEVGYLDAMRHAQWWNALGASAAVVPVGQTREGLPIGVQIVARPWCDEQALAVAAAVEAAFGYRVPPMAEI